MNVQDIREHMPVIASCGKRIGTVDRVEGFSIKLTKSAPAAHGEPRYIPLEWVEAVAENVRLNKDGEEAEQEWQEASICIPCSTCVGCRAPNTSRRPSSPPFLGSAAVSTPRWWTYWTLVDL